MRSHESLLQEVDAVLQQIDAVHQDHVSAHANHGSSMPPKVQQQPLVVPLPLQKNGAGIRTEKAEKTKRKDIELAKQQIEIAENEITKLKGALNVLDSHEDKKGKEQRIKRIIRLNKGILQSYNRVAKSYAKHGVGDTPDLEDMHEGMDQAQQEIIAWQKKLAEMPESEMSHSMRSSRPEHSWKTQPEYGDEDGSEAPGVTFSACESMCGFAGRCEEKKKSKVAQSWSKPFGLVWYEPFVTSREVTGIQLQQIYLMPNPRVDDALGEDIYDRWRVQMTAMTALFGMQIKGPETLCAKPSCDISFKYMGPLGINYFPQTSVPDPTASGGFLFASAAIYLDWQYSSMQFGRNWHPAEDPEVACSNDRVTYLGSLADPLEKWWLIRLDQKFTDNFKVVIAGSSKIDEKARSFLGPEPAILRNEPLYDISLQVRGYWCDSVFALGFDVQNVKPRTFDLCNLTLAPTAGVPLPATSLGHPENCYKTNAGVTSFSTMIFARIQQDDFVAKVKTYIGSQIGHPIGGYAVSSRNQTGCTSTVQMPPNQPIPPLQCYTPLRFAAVMGDFSIRRPVEFGIYAAFTKNLGAKERLFELPGQTGNNRFIIYAFQPSLDYTVVLSPRIKWHADPITLCGEVEYSRAAYGTINECGGIDCAVPVDCIRLIASIHYDF